MFSIETQTLMMMMMMMMVRDLSSRDHVTSALQTLHWLPIKQLIEFKLCLFVHLTINGKAPSTSKRSLLEQHQFLFKPPIVLLTINDLVIQRTELKFGQRAFSVAGL